MGLLDSAKNSFANNKANSQEFEPSVFWLNLELHAVQDDGEEVVVKAQKGIPIDNLKGAFYEALRLKGAEIPENSEISLNNIVVKLRRVESAENKEEKAKALLKFL